MIISDTAFFDPLTELPSIAESGTVLLQSFAKPFLSVERLLFLNNPNKNHNIFQIAQYVTEEVNIKGRAKAEIKTRDSFSVEEVKSFIIEFKGDYTDVNPEYKYVIRKKRSESINNAVLPNLSTDRVLIADYAEMNIEKERIKKQSKEITKGEELEELVSPDQEIQTIDIMVPDWIRELNNNDNKFIGVAGESKSGTSTSALIIASSASEIDKTLLVDMNFSNLGLSYLVEKTIIESEVNNIIMSELIKGGTTTNESGLRILKNESMKKEKLHILTLDLTTTQLLVTERDFCFYLKNLLSSIENNYRFIVFDIPLDRIKDFRPIVDRLDKMILVSPPYMNNIVSTLTCLTQEETNKTPIFNRVTEGKNLRDVILMRTDVFPIVHPNIKPITTRLINSKATTLIDRTMPVTGVYRFKQKYNDLGLFKQLMVGG